MNFRTVLISITIYCSSSTAFAICSAPDISPILAKNIADKSFQEIRDKTVQKNYHLMSLSFDYIDCKWSALYSYEAEYFPEHPLSYTFTFKNKDDVKLIKF